MGRVRKDVKNVTVSLPSKIVDGIREANLSMSKEIVDSLRLWYALELVQCPECKAKFSVRVGLNGQQVKP